MNFASRASVTCAVVAAAVMAAALPAFAAGAPTAPQNVAVTSAAMGSFTIHWDPPASDGGTAITGYQVSGSSTVAGTATGTCSGASSATSCTVTGLDNGVAYTFGVIATNGQESAPATTSPATAQGVPMVPRNVAAGPANASATVTWDAPTSNGGSSISTYQVTTTPASAGCTVAGSAGVLQCTLPGLTNGQVYTTQVTATNQYGTSNASATATVTPRTVPDAPAIQSVVHHDTSADVTWTAPAADGGNTITGYQVTTSPSSDGCSTNSVVALTCTLNGLQNGVSYQVYVKAKNDAGYSSNSTASSVVPSTTAGQPRSVTAVPKDSMATISWTAPASDGGNTITQYTVSTSPSSAGCTTSGLTCDLNSLANGTTYSVSVVATNINGNSTSAGTTSVTPRTVPDLPISPSATPDDQSAVVTWTPGGDGGSSISSYTLYTSPASPGCDAIPASTQQCTLTGLVNGVSYSVYVHATNAAGSGADASTTVTPRTHPSSPYQLLATPASQTLHVQWQAPANDGGSVVTNYIVTVNPNNYVYSTTDTQIDVTGLSNGVEYSITVAASNVAGVSTPSETVQSTPRTVPGTPVGLTTTPGNSAVLVSWSPPAFDGGSSITGYVVSISPSGTGCTTNGALSCVISNLTNGQAYGFTVAAINVAGTGGVSADVASTPVTVPTQPRNVTAAGGAGSMLVSWQAPASNGGSAITQYTVAGAPGGGCTTSATQCLITGLNDGVAYSFTVIATSEVGNGLPSSAAAATTWSVPSIPRNLSLIRPSNKTANKGLGRVKVTWLPPIFNGGSTITSYQVTGGGSTCTTAGTSCTLTGLTGSQTNVRVVAINAMGSSIAAHRGIRARMVTFSRVYASPTKVRFSGRSANPGQVVELLRVRNQNQQVVATVRAKANRTWSVEVNVPWYTASWRARSAGYKTGALTNGWSW